MYTNWMFQIILLYLKQTSSGDEPCDPPTAVAQCVSGTAFKLCINGKQSGRVHECPVDHDCNSLTVPFCVLSPNKTSKPTAKVKPALDPDEKIHYCIDEIEYDMISAFCSPIAHGVATIIGDTACTMFSYCNDSGVTVYQCPKGTLFNGIECVPDFVCTNPCQRIIYANLQDNVETAILAISTAGMKRWPIKNTSCRGYVELVMKSDLRFRVRQRECLHNTWYDPETMLCRFAHFCQERPHVAKQCRGKFDETANMFEIDLISTFGR